MGDMGIKWGLTLWGWLDNSLSVGIHMMQQRDSDRIESAKRQIMVQIHACEEQLEGLRQKLGKLDELERTLEEVENQLAPKPSLVTVPDEKVAVELRLGFPHSTSSVEIPNPPSGGKTGLTSAILGAVLKYGTEQSLHPSQVREIIVKEGFTPIPDNLPGKVWKVLKRLGENGTIAVEETASGKAYKAKIE
jgi:hypothetical protein